MDAATCARALFQRGGAMEDVVRGLRADGFSLIESIAALVKAAGMSFPDAKAAVLESATWADQRDRVATNQWIDPPQPPDATTLERLRAACREEPRIAEAWITGSRFTRADGSVDESTGIALILEPPLSEGNDEAQVRARAEIMARLDAAAQHVRGRHSWLFVSGEIIAAHAKHCARIYARAAVPD